MNYFRTSAQAVCALSLAIPGLAARPASAQPTNLTYKAEATVKETYDSNVYLQDEAPNPANVAAAQAAGFKPVEANKGSFVTADRSAWRVVEAATSRRPRGHAEVAAGMVAPAYGPDVS